MVKVGWYIYSGEKYLLGLFVIYQIPMLIHQSLKSCWGQNYYVRYLEIIKSFFAEILRDQS